MNKIKPLTIITLIFGIIFSSLIAFPRSAYANLSPTILNFFNENNIPFYDPSGSSNCSTGSVDLCGSTPEEKLWFGLLSLGYTPVQTAGIIGNIFAESTYNPARIYNECSISYDEASTDGTAKCPYGLIQWDKGRRIGMLNSLGTLTSYFKDGKGGHWDSISAETFISEDPSGYDALAAAELLYLQQELNDAYSSFLSQTANETNPREAADKFREIVEVTPSAADKRMDKAEEVYNTYNGASCSGSSSGSGGSSCFGSNSFEEYVKKYAWPVYHSKPYWDPTTDYKLAVTERLAKGAYVGGSSGHPGIDCGGFVTTLMQESGFSTEYNPNKGNTAAQESWVIVHWQPLNPDRTPIDTSILQPGDVAFTDGHTFVYVGNISGFSSVIASASVDGRAPMAGIEDLIKDRKEVVRWYRKR